MSRTIWKFPLRYVDTQTIVMRKGYRLLTVQLQGNEPMLWAIVDPDEDEKRVEIICQATGHDVCPGIDSGKFAYAYLGTVQPGELVFHFFGELYEND